MLEQIPVIELTDLRNSDKNSVDTVSQAFHDIGFVFIKMPQVARILPPIFSEFKKLFNASEEIKMRYKHKELFYQYGWTPPFTEEALACKRIGEGGTPVADAKENWFMGPENDPLNIWPEEVPGLQDAMSRLYCALYICGQEVLRSLGYSMGKPGEYFDEMLKGGPTRLRAIHYPPIQPEQVGKIVWGCQHTDINLVTVLPASTRQGLWIRRRDGQWIPGNAPENCVIAQVGDMLQHHTGREFLSAWHEVRAPRHPTTEGRLSAALFMHASSGSVLGQGNKRFPHMTAGELLEKRLREIGLAY